MNGPDRLARLAQLAAMIKEAELIRLAEANRRRDAARAGLARHDAAAPEAEAARATLIAARHDVWRAVRRAELNTILARELAAWSGARDQAARAFGRDDVLTKLARKLREKR